MGENCGKAPENVYPHPNFFLLKKIDPPELLATFHAEIDVILTIRKFLRMWDLRFYYLLSITYVELLPKLRLVTGRQRVSIQYTVCLRDTAYKQAIDYSEVALYRSIPYERSKTQCRFIHN